MRLIMYTGVFILLLAATQVMAQTTQFEPRLIKQLRREFNSSGYFSAKDSATYTYSQSRAWDTVKNDWKYDVRTEGDSRIVRDFDGQNKIAIENYQKFDAGFWWPDKRMLFEYQNNRITKMTYQEWADKKWQNLVNYEYSYDANGNKIVDLVMAWEQTGWQNSSRIISTYSTDGPIDVLHERWTQNAWLANANEHTDYVNGKKALYEHKDIVTGDILQRETYFYNSKGNDSLTIINGFNGTGGLDTVRYRFHYNGNNKQDTIQVQDVVNGVDKNAIQTYLFYNAYGLLALKRYQIWNDTTGRWYYRLNSIEEVYEYDQVKVNVNSTANVKPGCVLYPIPATGSTMMAEISVERTQLIQARIYSMDGRVVHAKNIPAVEGGNKIPIDISDLPAGNYVFNIISDSGNANTLFSIK